MTRYFLAGCTISSEVDANFSFPFLSLSASIYLSVYLSLLLRFVYLSFLLSLSRLRPLGFYWQGAVNIKLRRWGTFSSLPDSANLPRDEVPHSRQVLSMRRVFIPIVSPHPLGEGLLLNFG